MLGGVPGLFRLYRHPSTFAIASDMQSAVSSYENTIIECEPAYHISAISLLPV